MRYTIIIFLLLCSCSYNLDKSKLIGMDYRRFYGTEAEKLAKAVRDGDVKSIREEVLEHHVPVDIREEEYGITLLMMATFYNNFKSVKCLLELGADPNLCEDITNSRGVNSVFIACQYDAPSPKILQMLIDYGGDPDSQAKGVTYNNFRELIPIRDFALQAASENSLEKVKILLRAGADVNKYGEKNYQTAILYAGIHNQMDILLYLLQKGADYKITFRQYESIRDTTNYTEYNILDLLRESTYPLNSKKHKQKMEVVKFLKKRGWDYSKAPIPDYIIERAKKEYPDSWQEYLENY